MAGNAPPAFAGEMLGSQLAALRSRVQEQNTTGSLDGLVARELLAESADIRWQVDVHLSTWLAEDPTRHLSPTGLATLGYLRTHTCPGCPEVGDLIDAGFRAIRQRDFFPSDRITFLYDFRLLVGVTLAAHHVRARDPQHAEWLLGLLRDRRYLPADRFQEIGRRAASSLLTGDPVPLEFAADLHRVDELSLAGWVASSAHGVSPSAGMVDLPRRIVEATVLADSGSVSPPLAALLMAAAQNAVGGAARELVRGADAVGAVLRSFPAAMRRWRWDSDDLVDPVRWDIRSEREVQDVLWIMLRSCFDDVIDEDPLPKIGHASYRVDFALPRLRTLIEVKYVYRVADFKKIEKEIMQDAAAYLRRSSAFDRIVVFIYDDSASVEHHDLTEQTLRGVTGIADVVIVSRPGMLAGRADRSSKRAS